MGRSSAEVAVVGAGVVGLACAAELARRGHSVLVVERHGKTGQETSSRNSEVIHAGLYYPADSLKATLCVEGRERLYRRCAERSLPHRRLGKLVVACEPAERATLEDIRARGLRNGAGALELLDADEVARREPRVGSYGALWSPESGIVDAHALMDSYQAELEAAGATVVFHTRVEALHPVGEGGGRVDTRTDRGEAFPLDVGWVVNCAGLEADRIAALAGVDVAAAGYRQHPCKGDYFSVAPALGALTRHLVYPVPAGAGLGIHVTVDLGGRYRFGPDAEYVDAVSYDVDPSKARAFAAAVRRYLPEIEPGHLSPDYAGVRPKLAGPGESFRDFVIAEESGRGAPGLINLLGIESPGLTAAGAIAARVGALI